MFRMKKEREKDRKRERGGVVRDVIENLWRYNFYVKITHLKCSILSVEICYRLMFFYECIFKN